MANRMPVPCFLVAHPKGTLMWDVGVIPDATVEKQAASGGARYDVNATAAALVKRTLKGQLARSATAFQRTSPMYRFHTLTKITPPT